MKKFLIAALFMILIFTSCEYEKEQKIVLSDQISSAPTPVSSSESKPTPPKASSASKTSSAEQKPSVPTVVESPVVENHDVEIQLLRTQKEMLIQELYSLTNAEQSQISEIINKQISLTAEKTQLENQIRELKNEYGRSLALGEGTPSSYSLTIKRQYEALEKDLVEVKRLLSTEYSNDKIAEIQENNRPKKQEIGDQIKEVDSRISELQG